MTRSLPFRWRYSHGSYELWRGCVHWAVVAPTIPKDGWYWYALEGPTKNTIAAGVAYRFPIEAKTDAVRWCKAHARAKEPSS